MRAKLVKESLLEYYQIPIEQKINQLIKQIPSIARGLSDSQELRDLIKQELILPDGSYDLKLADDLRRFYAAKGGKYKTKESMIEATKDFLDSAYVNKRKHNLDSIRRKIDDQDLNAEIVYDKNNLLVLKPYDFEASKALGSPSWAITYAKRYFDQYSDCNMFFIYDFSKDPQQKESLIGSALQRNLLLYYRDDSQVKNPDEFLHNLFKEDYEQIITILTNIN